MKMDINQVAASKPWTYAKNISNLHHLPSKPCVLPINFNPLSGTFLSLRLKSSSSLQCLPLSKSRQPLQVCLAGGRGIMDNNNEVKGDVSRGNEDSTLKAFEKAIEKFKRGKYYDNGGSGVKPPRGGSGSGDGSGGSEDGRFAGMSDETLQVVLATVGFIFLYIFILSGEELTKLARDYIKYLSSGKQSVRLKRAMFKWGRLYRSLTEKVVDRYWLEKALKRNYLESKSDQ